MVKRACFLSMAFRFACLLAAAIANEACVENAVDMAFSKSVDKKEKDDLLG
jgi:hypothetical protein